jgi:hypothetical protein
MQCGQNACSPGFVGSPRWRFSSLALQAGHAETEHLFNDALIGKMKRGAYLVNTARGKICDRDAVVRLATRATSGFRSHHRKITLGEKKVSQRTLWRNLGTTLHLMRFQLVTPPRASDALQQPMSAVLFESDGSSIAVGVDGSSRTFGKCPPGDISTLVNEALLKALATYYSKWEGLQQRWR